MATKQEARAELKKKLLQKKELNEVLAKNRNEARELRTRLEVLETDSMSNGRKAHELVTRLHELYKDSEILHVTVGEVESPTKLELLFYRYVDGEKVVHLRQWITQDQLPAFFSIIDGHNEMIYEMVENGFIILSEDEFVVIPDTRSDWCYNISDALMEARVTT